MIYTKLTDIPCNRYRVILADPPWQMSNQGTRASPQYYGAQRKEARYDTLDFDTLRSLTMGNLALPDSTLFLWRVSAMGEEGYELMRAWGFIQKAEIVWVKPQIGMGNYIRNAHEICLIGIKGHPQKYDTRSVRSTFDFPRNQHSRKPDRIYEIVETLYPGPYLELFARRPREGWDSFGDEVR